MDGQCFALLIDAENVSAKYIKPILTELSKYGNITYKRIYGDWTSTQHSSWKDELLKNSITPIQQFSYTQGKNATDSAMIIDAMDILYTKDVDGFCIVSSDSDFTRLVSRLRESGKMVISDRFVDSSVVYQGIARGLGKETVASVNAPGIGEHRPDCVFFIDLSEEEGIHRKKKQKKLDRMEQESIDFHHLVSEGYREVLKNRPEVIPIDGDDSIENIHRQIRNEIEKRIKAGENKEKEG